MKQFALILAFCLIPLLSFSQVIRLQENFNSSSLPVGWTNSAVTGTQSWSFGIDGSSSNAGNNNLDSTAMAFFDDDNLGSSSTNNIASLTTPVFNNLSDGTSLLSFDYNFRELAGTADLFYVEVYDGTNWITVFTRSANDCGNWIASACTGNFPKATVDLTPYRNSNCQVRFTYDDGNDWCWYVGIDNVVVVGVLKNDLSVEKIEEPTNSCFLGNSETVKVLIRNNGSSNVTAPFNLTVNVDNGSQNINETVNSTINAGDSLLYTFNSTLNLSAKRSYTLKTYTSYLLDTNRINDTLVKLVTNNTPLTIPFKENFESGAQNWITYGQNSSWSIGQPSSNFINNAFSGLATAGTNVSGNYNNSEQSYLETPCITSASANRLPIVSFHLNFISEFGFDFVILESSIDNGASWQVVNQGSFSNNWYSGNSGWNGISNGWMKIENSLDSLIGQSDFKLRFKFNSDGSGVRDGFVIDDFAVINQDSTDLSLTFISNPSQNSNNICGYGLENIQVELLNNGLVDIDSALISYRVNNGAIITEQINSTILPQQRISYQFQNPHNFSAFGSYAVDAWISVINDGVQINDSILNYQITHVNNLGSFDSIPFYENFDSLPWNALPANTIDQNWSITSLSGSSTGSSNYSWQVNNGSTPSSITGPSGDFSGTGNYLYTEASNSNAGDIAYLTSPCFRLPLNKFYRLEFYTHGYGADIPALIVEINTGNTWEQIANFNSHSQTAHSSAWTRRGINLSQYAGAVAKIRFKTVKGNSFQGDLAIDNLSITEQNYNDIGVDSISIINNSCISVSALQVQVKFQNNGISKILPGQYIFNYQLNNDPVVSEVYLDTLKNDSSAVFVFSTPLNGSRPNFNNSLKVYAQSIIDSNKVNDTALISFDNSTKSLPFSENFDSITNVPCQDAFFTIANTLPNYMSSMNGGWTVHKDNGCNFSLSQGATFQNLTGPSAAASGDQFIYLMGSFWSSRNDVLSLGCFDFTNENDITLEFNYHKYGVQGMGDLYIEIEDSSSQTITVDSIIGQTHPQSTSPWTLKSINLNRFAGQVVTVNFRADSPPTPISSRGDMALDDISIYNPLKVSTKQNSTQETSITLYPNPNNGNFNLNVSNALVGKNYQVFDLKGGLIKEGRINATNSQIELNNADRGVYFMRIEGLTKVEKLIVQ